MKKIATIVMMRMVMKITIGKTTKVLMTRKTMKILMRLKTKATQIITRKPQVCGFAFRQSVDRP